MITYTEWVQISAITVIYGDPNYFQLGKLCLKSANYIFLLYYKPDITVFTIQRYKEFRYILLSNRPFKNLF